MNDFSLEIFRPTIHTMWNKQPKALKDDLTNRLVSLFGKDIFDTSKVLKKAGKHLNIVQDQYRVHLEKNPRYERPPMIPSREWKSIVEYGKEKGLRNHEEQGGMQYIPKCNGKPYYYYFLYRIWNID